MSSPVAIFEDVLNYDQWLDGVVPYHPDFEKAVRIQDIITPIKSLLLSKILEGCERLVRNFEYRDTIMFTILHSSFHHHNRLWQAVISGHKYGVIYLCSRSDARDFYLDVVKKSPSETQLVNDFLSKDYAAIRAINYGVHQFIHDETIEKDFASKFVPPNAIAAIGEYILTQLTNTFIHSSVWDFGPARNLDLHSVLLYNENTWPQLDHSECSHAEL